MSTERSLSFMKYMLTTTLKGTSWSRTAVENGTLKFQFSGKGGIQILRSCQIKSNQLGGNTTQLLR